MFLYVSQDITSVVQSLFYDAAISKLIKHLGTVLCPTDCANCMHDYPELNNFNLIHSLHPVK